MPQPADYFIVTEVISEGTHARVLEAAAQATFHDGATTAGRWEGHRKRNMQCDRAAIQPICKAVMQEVMTNRTLCNRALPHEAVQPMLNRYRTGDFYGIHEDSPIQSGIRADLSYTLFLSDPSAYEGGELRLGTGEAEVAIKLPARALVCYPSGTVHQVSPIVSGERLAMVGWMRSIVRDAGQRSMLSDLREAIDGLAERDGLDEQVCALSRVYGGLMRQWAFA
jgi:PKHD-type hydroxylase